MTNHYDDYESYTVENEQYVDYRDHLNKILDKRTYDLEVLNNINQGDITQGGMVGGVAINPLEQFTTRYYPMDNEPYKEREFVNHPDHYNPGPYEVIKIIEHYDLGFHLGNVIKYILRAGVKNGDTYNEDLKKALWYLQRKIDNKESNNA